MISLLQVRCVFTGAAVAISTLGIAGRCVAQVPASVGAYVLADDSAVSPLRIIGFESRREPFKGPYAIVENTSTREVAGFRLEAAVRAPRQCLSGEQLELYGSDRGFETTRIAAGRAVRVYWNL